MDLASLYTGRDIRRARQRIEATRAHRYRRATLLGSRRPELVGYVVAAVRRLSVESRAAAWGGLELACEVAGALDVSSRRTVDEVLEAHEENLGLASAVGAAHPRIANRRLVLAAAVRQRALLEALFEEAAASPEDEHVALFLVFKTLVDVLDLDHAAPWRHRHVA